MATKWISAAKGIRYKEHESRKHGKRFDRYFALQFKRNGKVLNEAVGWSSDGVTQAECERLLSILRENWRTGTGPQTLREMREGNIKQASEKKAQEELEQSLTIGSIFEGDYMKAQHDKSEGSIAAEKRLMKNHVIPFFGNAPLLEITPHKIDAFIAHMKQKTSERTGRKLSAATIKYSLAVVRQIWNYALSRNLIDKPYPAKNIKTPTVDNRRTRFLTRDEAELLLDALKKRSQDLHDEALLSLYCGLRAGELFKLEWSDVDFTEGFIYVRDKKNKESSTAWLALRAKTMLERRFAENTDSPLVFPSRNGNARDEISKVYPKVVKELGFNEVSGYHGRPS